jgi:transcriptional regulator with XRE-family HTH domain
MKSRHMTLAGAILEQAHQPARGALLSDEIEDALDSAAAGLDLDPWTPDYWRRRAEEFERANPTWGRGKSALWAKAVDADERHRRNFLNPGIASQSFLDPEAEGRSDVLQLLSELRSRFPTQAALADFLGVSQGHVSKYLRGEHDLGTVKLFSALRRLGWGLALVPDSWETATLDGGPALISVREQALLRLLRLLINPPPSTAPRASSDEIRIGIENGLRALFGPLPDEELAPAARTITDAAAEDARSHVVRVAVLPQDLSCLTKLLIGAAGPTPRLFIVDRSAHEAIVPGYWRIVRDPLVNFAQNSEIQISRPLRTPYSVHAARQRRELLSTPTGTPYLRAFLTDLGNTLGRDRVTGAVSAELSREQVACLEDFSAGQRHRLAPTDGLPGRGLRPRIALFSSSQADLLLAEDSERNSWELVGLLFGEPGEQSTAFLYLRTDDLTPEEIDRLQDLTPLRRIENAVHQAAWKQAWSEWVSVYGNGALLPGEKAAEPPVPVLLDESGQVSLSDVAALRNALRDAQVVRAGLSFDEGEVALACPPAKHQVLMRASDLLPPQPRDPVSIAKRKALRERLATASSEAIATDAAQQLLAVSIGWSARMLAPQLAALLASHRPGFALDLDEMEESCRFTLTSGAWTPEVPIQTEGLLKRPKTLSLMNPGEILERKEAA